MQRGTVGRKDGRVYYYGGFSKKRKKRENLDQVLTQKRLFLDQVLTLQHMYMCVYVRARAAEGLRLPLGSCLELLVLSPCN